MKRTSDKSVLAVMALLVCGFMALACQSSGPEFVGGDTRVVAGTLPTDVASETEIFAITTSGTVNIMATTIAAVDPESAEPIENPVLGVSVGQPVAAGEAQCQLTFSQILEESGSFSVFFSEGLFCITVFRAPGTPIDAVLTYVVTMTGAFS